MIVHKRGRRYCYDFIHNGERVQCSTHQSDRRVARQIEAAHRTALAKGEVRIRERKPAPALSEFSQRFLDNARLGRRRAPRESTGRFYTDCMNQILSYEPLAGAKLDAITPELVEKSIKSPRAGLSPSRGNGLLRTLRRCLQVATDLHIITGVPKITLLQGERERDFVLSPERKGCTCLIARSPWPMWLYSCLKRGGVWARLATCCGATFTCSL